MFKINNTTYILKNYEKELIKSNLIFKIYNTELKSKTLHFILNNINSITIEYIKLCNNDIEKVNEFIKLIDYIDNKEILISIIDNLELKDNNILINKIKSEDKFLDSDLLFYIENNDKLDPIEIV